MFDLCSMLLWIKRVTCMVPEKWLRAFWYEAALLWHINCSEWVVLGQNMNYSISYFSHCTKCCPPHFAAQQKWTFKNRIAKGGWWKSRGGYFSDATYLFLLSKREENWEENRYATRFINMQPPFSRDSMCLTHKKVSHFVLQKNFQTLFLFCKV